MKKNRTSTVITLALCLIAIALLYVLDLSLPKGHMLFVVLKKSAIYALVAVSMNLLNGFTGLFSLGQAGFMLIGAYTYAICTIPMAAKDKVYQYCDCAIRFTLPIPVALVLAGLFAALRKLDDPEIHKVYARCPVGGGIAYAVQNRLKKAAAFRIIDPREGV